MTKSPRQERTEDFTPQWCQDLLKDPTYQQTNPSTRIVDGPHGHSFNSLIGKTLFTDGTLRAIRLLYKPKTDSTTFGGELLALISLGDDMCSHANVLHGGINTTIIDEVGGGLAVMENSANLMAVNFNVNLRKAVRTPGIVLVRAWMERKSEGRKVWVRCRVLQDEVTCIESESLYLKVDVTPARM